MALKENNFIRNREVWGPVSHHLNNVWMIPVILKNNCSKLFLVGFSLRLSAEQTPVMTSNVNYINILLPMISEPNSGFFLFAFSKMLNLILVVAIYSYKRINFLYCTNFNMSIWGKRKPIVFPGLAL